MGSDPEAYMENMVTAMDPSGFKDFRACKGMSVDGKAEKGGHLTSVTSPFASDIPTRIAGSVLQPQSLRMEETAFLVHTAQKHRAKSVHYRTQLLDLLQTKMPWTPYLATYHIILNILTIPPISQFPKHEIFLFSMYEFSGILAFTYVKHGLGEEQYDRTEMRERLLIATEWQLNGSDTSTPGNTL
ncbi:hypothetical protein STEG23_027152 [Scotinomys teguina]